jgi:hypothetical protein
MQKSTSSLHPTLRLSASPSLTINHAIGIITMMMLSSSAIIAQRDAIAAILLNSAILIAWVGITSSMIIAVGIRSITLWPAG